MSIFNDNGFKSFLRGENGRVCLNHDLCSKA